jgi:hypothetical protein
MRRVKALRKPPVTGVATTGVATTVTTNNANKMEPQLVALKLQRGVWFCRIRRWVIDFDCAELSDENGMCLPDQAKSYV